VYIDARNGSRSFAGIRHLRVHCRYTGKITYTGGPSGREIIPMDALTDTKIRNAKPVDKEYTIADS
jgi:hypothetical protein